MLYGRVNEFFEFRERHDFIKLARDLALAHPQDSAGEERVFPPGEFRMEPRADFQQRPDAPVNFRPSSQVLLLLSLPAKRPSAPRKSLASCAEATQGASAGVAPRSGAGRGATEGRAGSASPALPRVSPLDSLS